MNTEEPNPYQSPKLSERTRRFVISPATVASYLLPPILAIASTLIIWLAMANLMSSQVTMTNVMFLWSITFFVSSGVSTCFINLAWPRRLSAFAMAIGWVLFGVIFCFVEGDTSNGTDQVQAAILYGTLSAAPIVVFAITRQLGKLRFGP